VLEKFKSEWVPGDRLRVASATACFEPKTILIALFLTSRAMQRIMKGQSIRRHGNFHPSLARVARPARRSVLPVRNSSRPSESWSEIMARLDQIPHAHGSSVYSRRLIKVGTGIAETRRNEIFISSNSLGCFSPGQYPPVLGTRYPTSAPRTAGFGVAMNLRS
jgi:hypothetical protein